MDQQQYERLGQEIRDVLLFQQERSDELIKQISELMIHTDELIEDNRQYLKKADGDTLKQKTFLAQRGVCVSDTSDEESALCF